MDRIYTETLPAHKGRKWRTPKYLQIYKTLRFHTWRQCSNSTSTPPWHVRMWMNVLLTQFYKKLQTASSYPVTLSLSHTHKHTRRHTHTHTHTHTFTGVQIKYSLERSFSMIHFALSLPFQNLSNEVLHRSTKNMISENRRNFREWSEFKKHNKIQKYNIKRLE